MLQDFGAEISQKVNSCLPMVLSANWGLNWWQLSSNILTNKMYWVKYSKVKEKVKGKINPRTGHEGPEGEYRYSPTLSLTSALDRGGGKRHTPAALPPGKTRYPLYRRSGGPQDRSGQVRKISPQPGFDPRTVQPAASRYTDWATRPTNKIQ
jgi:hypothetical protein